ncbi:RRQRL motif-containing zinc-binding protein [Streptomyces cyaneofuscatus]
MTRVPRSDAALPEFDRGAVPEGLVTRRVLREMGLSPGDNEGPVAILRCRLCATRPQWSCRHPTRGFLLRVDLAKPKRVPTLAQELALDRAMAARSTCSRCSRRLPPPAHRRLLRPLRPGLRAHPRHLRHHHRHAGHTPAGRMRDRHTNHTPPCSAHSPGPAARHHELSPSRDRPRHRW